MVVSNVLMKKSVMPEHTRLATPNQEVVWRIINTSEMVEDEVRCQIVDPYTQTMLNSEYPLERVRKIIVGGMRRMRECCLNAWKKATPDGSHSMLQHPNSLETVKLQSKWPRPTGSIAGESKGKRKLSGQL
jgi:hypothetical protein